MRVLLIGSGGREHALAEAIVASPLLEELQVAPGNPGTAAHNVALDVSDHHAVVGHCAEEEVDLVVVGPEVPLVAGLADDLARAGVACFGPSAAAARLEGSKSFARAFADRHGIPGPQNETFTDVDDALKWLANLGSPVVVKADGLAAGKGVIIPENEPETEAAIRELLGGSLGDASGSIVLEERMTGEELSLFGICSAHQIDPLGGLSAQDHKRVGDGDTGPNTGGMGAFAPVPSVTPEFAAELAQTFLDPVQWGMVQEGTPYVGVVYAGIMLTPQGPRLVEYNCRFGDPEAQILLPLLDGDLLAVMHAAATGSKWEPLPAKADRTAATVVVCAQGYPAKPVKGVAIPSLPEDSQTASVLHAGTTYASDGSLVSSGGRVLNVVGVGSDLGSALANSYGVVNQLTGPDLFARSDIGWRYMQDQVEHPDAYAASGVNIAAGAATTKRIGDAVKSTHDDRVVAGLGSFGGVFSLAGLVHMEDPLLVATTDGVGTKTVLAEALNQWEGCGADIVNHGINDVLVQGAQPLFFLDTVASERLDPEVVGRAVDGMAAACREGNCVLLGGETAEMPGVLTPGSVDIAGTLIGAVERSKLLPKPGIGAGHVLIGMASSGLHTNGYSLARKVVAESGLGLTDPLPGGSGESIGDALLAVHRSYLPVVNPALELDLIDALAHITGGGIIDNLPRVLPEDIGAVVDTSAWEMPPLFEFLISQTGIDLPEAHRILNCGIGMVAVVEPDKVDACRAAIDEQTWIIGECVAGSGVTVS